MMWMMGYNDGGDFNSIQDPFAGHGKLRPLIPRPATAAAVATSPPCLARIHGTDLLALNHHLAMVEQNKRDQLNTQQVVVSSRWNPTPEQLQTLEELYRRGTRTPSAEQIQQITAQLRRYGKIEGKNVFYWFQNHKARERQKRRRQHDEQQQQPHYVNGDKREAPGANRTVFEVEQTKNWASPTNSSTVLAERGICTQGAAAAGAKAAAAAEASECKADGWVHFDEEEDDDTDMLLQHRRNATWQSMHLSSCSSSSSPTNLVNTSSAPPTVANCAATIIPSTFGTILETSKPPHQDNLINIFFKPYSSQSFEDHSAAAVGGEEAQTLQLFPLQSGRSRHRQWADEEEDDDEEEEGSDVGMSTNSCRAPPYQFFEFLPLKN